MKPHFPARRNIFVIRGCVASLYMSKKMFSMILAMTTANRHAAVNARKEEITDHSALVGVLMFLEAVNVIKKASRKGKSLT